MAIDFPETLSTQDAAQIVCRHPRTVARWVRAGKLPGTYDEVTGLTLVYAEGLRARLQAGEAQNRRAPSRVAASPRARPRDAHELTDAEWRARFGA